MIAINDVAGLLLAFRNHPYNFTSLGSYTLMYVHADGECSHPACARKQALEQARLVRDRSSERIVTLGTYDEGPTLECILCNEPIESSYGDPDNHEDCVSCPECGADG